MVAVLVAMHMNSEKMAVDFGDAMKVDYDGLVVVMEAVTMVMVEILQCHAHLAVETTVMHDDIQGVDFLPLVGYTLLVLVELVKLPAVDLSAEEEEAAAASNYYNLVQEPQQSLLVVVGST